MKKAKGRLQNEFVSRQQIVPLYNSLVPISSCADKRFIPEQKRYKRKTGTEYPWQSVALREVASKFNWRFRSVPGGFYCSKYFVYFLSTVQPMPRGDHVLNFSDAEDMMDDSQLQ